MFYDNSKTVEYSLAQKTIDCYAALHNYSVIRINVKDHPEYKKECPGNDLMFKR
jgi:hypothetical protein